jgi:3',5'-cyclic AMP phosphodiesterase CpdA
MTMRTATVMIALVLSMTTSCTRDAAPERSASSSGGLVTFAVVGDNRGGSDGAQPAVFVEMLDSIARHGPLFVVNTGDIVYGRAGTDERAMRRMWSIYRDARERLDLRVHHAPGNHDIFDAMSGRLWDELLGPRHYAIDTAGVRIIVLDCESDPGRVDDRQRAWLREQLESLDGRTAFVVLHEPLFPVDAHIGSSLDRHPDDRDLLHALFVEHRESIGAVFLGHEHFYNDETRDGVRYVITGGGGAPLYAPAELGGFYHFLIARHDRARRTTDIAVHRLSDRRDGRSVVPETRGGTIEEFDSLHVMTVWDQSARLSSTHDQTSHLRRAARIEIDASRYRWPMLAVDHEPTIDPILEDSIVADIWCPAEVAGRIMASVAIETPRKERAPVRRLAAGWNRVATHVNVRDIPMGYRPRTMVFFEADAGLERTFVVVDNIRTTSRSGASRSIESFERPLFWGVWNDAVRASRVASSDGGALAIDDGPKSRRGARLFARLDPAWNLTETDSIVVEVDAQEDGTAMTLIVGYRGERLAAPEVALRRGSNRVGFSTRPLEDRNALGAVESIELHFPRRDASAHRFVVRSLRLVGARWQ